MSLKKIVKSWLEILPIEEAERVRPDDKFADFIDKLSPPDVQQILTVDSNTKVRLYRKLSKLTDAELDCYVEQFVGVV